MTEIELKTQLERVVQYNELKRQREEAKHALRLLTEDWKDIGPCGKGPFTGNTRESRQVKSMSINFTATRGGAHPVSLDIPGMYIEAWEVGAFLVAMLEKRITELNTRVENV